MLRRSRAAFVAVGLFSLFINLLMLTAPLYMLQIYDRVLASHSIETLIALTILAVGLLLMNALVEFARSCILVRISVALDSRLAGKVFDAVLADRLDGSVATSRSMRDSEAIRSFITSQGLIAFFDAPWTPLYILVIFLFHPLLGFIALGGAIVLLLLAVVTEVATRRSLRDGAGFANAAHENVESTMRNAEAIEAMGMAKDLKKRWLHSHRAALAFHARATDRSGALTATVKLFRQSLQIGMLGVGAYLAIKQSITPGVMIAASIVMSRALAPVETSVANWRGLVMARGAYRRLRELLAHQAKETDHMSLPPPSGRIAVENLTGGPPKLEKPVLHDVSFVIGPGDSLAVTGPSGAGKSTLGRYLVGIWRPGEGSVRFDGASIVDWDRSKLGRHLGYLPQDIELFGGSVAENIRRFGEEDADAVVSAARLAGAHEMILQLPGGYDTEIGDAGLSLSGGQRQRIGIARAVYGGPAVIVLDEPNSNLDFEGEQALRSMLSQIKSAGQTVIVISHRSSVLSCVDKHLVLREGRIERFGPKDELTQNGPRHPSRHQGEAPAWRARVRRLGSTSEVNEGDGSD